MGLVSVTVRQIDRRKWLWQLRLTREELTHAKVGGQPSHIFYTPPSFSNRTPEAAMNMEFFTELRARINAQLEATDAPHRDLQIRRFSWLYGALGEVPSSVMLICENPSLAGVERADRQTVDG